MMTNLTPDEAARFRTKYDVNGIDCFIWNGPLDRDGYGVFYLRRRNHRAHRVAWYAAFGEIPEGHVVNHKCRNRACVNWQHLECVTVRENALKDSAALGALNARKTHCKQGHVFDKIYISGTTGRTQRICSICDRAKARRLKAKWRAEDILRV